MPPYCACMRQIISVSFTAFANKKLITVFLSSLMQIDNGAAMLNGLQYSNVRGKTSDTLFRSVASIINHSALDTSAVAKHQKEKLQ
ncbi:hypothetical protein TNCV_4348881 [Trichonephila clavipes]|nr:hypothetical protein TNCV_4348881 [Trichonephila clavipes]